MVSQQKTIAIVTTHIPFFQTLTGSLIEYLVARGWRVFCLGPAYDDEMLGWLEKSGAKWQAIALHPDGFDPGSQIRSLAALSRFFKSKQADVVLGLGLSGSVLAALAARIGRVKRVVTMIDEISSEFKQVKGIRQRVRRETNRRLFGAALSRSHAVVFQNEDDPITVAELGVMPVTVDVHIVGGSGVDLEAIAQAPLPPIDQGLTFLMAAPMLRYKGVETYCEAVKLLSRLRSRANWQLLGPEGVGPEAIGLEQLRELSAYIEYIGPNADIIHALEQAHVFVLPSELEGMPQAALYALAVGRPIITTDTPGCRETVDEIVNGILVAPGDATALAQAMEHVLRRPDLIPSMARASRRKAERLFDARLTTQALVNAIGLDRLDGAPELDKASGWY